MKRCGGLRKLLDSNILHSPAWATTAPALVDTAVFSNTCRCICEMNINLNGS